MLSNLSKPDNKKWKLIADVALYILPLELVAVANLPFSDNTIFWVGFGLTQLTVIFKAISKFTSEDV